jgi:hypothetical protein
MTNPGSTIDRDPYDEFGGIAEYDVGERLPLAVRHSRRALTQRRYRRRRLLALVGLILAALLMWLAVSLGGALTNPALGSSTGARLAEWSREHGGSGIINWIESEWYSHHPPPVGGKPPAGAIRPLPPPSCLRRHRRSPGKASGHRSAGW